MSKTKSLQQFKNDHPIFFSNKPNGEKHNVHKGFLITTSYDWYTECNVTKVWQETGKEKTLLSIGKFSSVSSAKEYIDELVQ